MTAPDRFERSLARVSGAVEHRDPTAATTTLRFHTPDWPQIPEWDPDAAVRYGLLANLVAARCIEIIADTIAALPFLAGPTLPTAPTDRPDHNPNARLSRLLGPPPGGPSPEWTARALWAWSIAQRLATGAMAWELELDGGGRMADRPVAALWPLVTANLKAIPSERGNRYFDRFRYGRNDDLRDLAYEQVFYSWRPRPTDPRQPYSPLEPARYALAIAAMGDRYQHALLANGGVPATVVTTTEFGDEKARRRWRRQWESTYRGPDNAGKVMFAEVEGQGDRPVAADVDVKVLGLSNVDQQFAEQHKAQLGLIAVALGVPWSRLDASGRTFDNASEEDRAFWRSTILPLCNTIADDVNLRLAPRLGPEVGWFDLSGVKALQEHAEPVTAAVGAPAMTQAQLMTIDEARADYGLGPLPGGAGDRLMTAEEIAALKGAAPADMTVAVRELVGEFRQVLGEIRAPQTGGRPPTAPEPPSAVSENREADPAEVEARRARIWRRADAVASTLEGRWEAAFRRLFARQERATLARLEGNRGRRAVEQRAGADEIFDPAHWGAETSDLAEDLYEAVVAAGFARVSDAFAVDFDLDAAWARDFITARANQLAGQVTDTTYQAIQGALVDGTAAGESIPDLARRIRDVFSDASTRRATVIARTEVVSAYNGSASLAATQLPADVVGGQEWIATRDGRTREAHGSADGQVVAIGAPFTVGGESLAYPGDPAGSAANVVQCRCTVAFLTPDEMAERTERSGRRTELRVACSVIDLVRSESDLPSVRRLLEAVA